MLFQHLIAQSLHCTVKAPSGDRAVTEGERLEYVPLAPQPLNVALSAMSAESTASPDIDSGNESPSQPGDTEVRAPLKLNIKLNSKRQTGWLHRGVASESIAYHIGTNINPITGKRNYVRRSQTSESSCALHAIFSSTKRFLPAPTTALMKRAVRGRPSKQRKDAEDQLAAEHEVAELTLATSLQDGMLLFHFAFSTSYSEHIKFSFD